MRVCILRSYLGSDRHLLLDTRDPGFGCWVRAVPDDAWALGVSQSNHHLDLRVLAEYAGLEDKWDIPEQFLRADEEAGVDSRRPICTIPRKALLAHVGELVARAGSLEEAGADQYITGLFADTRRQIADLRSARVDTAVWQEAMRSDASPALQTFEPDCDGAVEAVEYDQMGSLTGRLTVRSGPQILTLRRDLRRVLQPTRRGKRLLMIDFVSHEPRVALSQTQGSPPLDIYGWFRETHMPSMSREDSKGAIISTLYGMSPSTLSERLGCTLIEAKSINELVRVTFGLDKLEKDLLRVYGREGTIRSAFGRRIKPSSGSPGVLVNSYIQSTAFDVAMSGFREILGMCARSLIETHVFFYIHDAVVLEIPERDEERLRALLESPVSVPGFPGEYWTKVKEVTE